MGSSGKKKTTMAKMARENKLRERRAIKAAKKDARKQAAADGPPAAEAPAWLGDPIAVSAAEAPADEATSAFADVSSEPTDPRAKEVALTRLQESPDEELAVFGDSLRDDARDAGATEQEVREAQRDHPGHAA